MKSMIRMEQNTVWVGYSSPKKNMNVKKIDDEAVQHLCMECPHDERICKSIDKAIHHEGDSHEEPYTME